MLDKPGASILIMKVFP